MLNSVKGKKRRPLRNPQRGLNSEPQNIEGWFRFAQSFYKIDRIDSCLRYSVFSIQYSTCPQCLRLPRYNFNHLIHNSMIYPIRPTLHGRRVLIFFPPSAFQLPSSLFHPPSSVICPPPSSFRPPNSSTSAFRIPNSTLFSFPLPNSRLCLQNNPRIHDGHSAFINNDRVKIHLFDVRVGLNDFGAQQ